MRTSKVLAVILASILAAWAASAADPDRTSGTILLFPGLTPDDAPAVLASCDRLVWDRLMGRAVAQASSSAAGRLENIPHSLLPGRGGEAFLAALQAEMPDYAAGARAESRYAIKVPATLIKPPAAPRRSPEASDPLAPSACPGEGFEVPPIWYEDGGLWWHFEGGQPDNAAGAFFWADESCDAASGSWAAGAFAGGADGQGIPCGSPYAPHTDSWMEYVPWVTCTSGAPDARLRFSTRLQSEEGTDLFYYLASVDGTHYSGYSLSGNLADTWYEVTQDLREWYGLGDLTAFPRFALAFVFQSGDQVAQGFGARLDDVALRVGDCPPITLSPTSLPDGNVGTGYYLAIRASGGTAPYAYSKTDGTKPPGVTLDADGLLSGVPTEAGTFNFTVTATDANACTGSQHYAMTVAAVPPPVIMSMVKKGNPFRIVVYGSNLKGEIKVFISANRWSKVLWKSTNQIVIKGGASLKAAVPQGTPTDFTFVNPDGGAAMVTGWSW